MLAVSLLFAKSISVLFIGNSHTGVNNIPDLVSQIAAQANPSVQIQAKYLAYGHLEDAAKDQNVFKTIQSGKFDAIVLQGAMVSMSHKYNYSQAGGIELCKAANKSGAKTYLFVEWPRENIDETEYTLDVYRGIAKSGNATVIPACKTFDRIHKANPKLDLWSDGNHATLTGSYIAAQTIARYLLEAELISKYRPDSITASLNDQIQQEANRTYKNSRG